MLALISMWLMGVVVKTVWTLVDCGKVVTFDTDRQNFSFSVALVSVVFEAQ